MKTCFIVTLLLVTISLAMPVSDAAAECTIDYLADPNHTYILNPSAGIGQSFTACLTGYVTRVSLQSSSGDDAIFKILAGTHISAAPITQSLHLGSGINTIVLAPPFPVTSGLMYSFGVFADANHLGITSHFPDIYPEGMALNPSTSGDAIQIPDHDVAFSLDIMTDPISTQSSTWSAVKALYR